jgi:K+-sensing histidine kinase KdpD
MDLNYEKIAQINLLKAIGHESRTILNSITGPIQIIRSLSDEPKLIEPLRFLELSVSRFDKFSFRALLLSDLLKDDRRVGYKTFELVDTFKFILLDLTDLLDFHSIKVELQNDNTPLQISSNTDLLSHCILILLERAISLATEGSTIIVNFIQTNNKVSFTVTCNDNGFLNKSLIPVFGLPIYPTDIDLFLLKYGIEALKTKVDLSISSSNQSIIKLELT